MEAMLIRDLEDVKRMQDSVSLHFRIGCEKLERKKEKLEALRIELDQCLDLNDREREILDNTVQEREMEILEYQKILENATRLAKEDYKEAELCLEHFVQKQASELQVYKDRRANSYMKRVNELDREQFMNALKVKYRSADSEKAEELYSLWEGYLSDPSWYPFKVVMVGEKMEEVVDEDEDKLKELKNEFGEEVFAVVEKAINKYNENNPLVSFPVLEVLNTSGKAVIKEGIARLLLGKNEVLKFFASITWILVDENDKKLKELRNELGEEVYEVVVKALNKFNKNNPSASDPVPVLWNNSANRASLKDAFARLHICWKDP